MNMKNVPAGWNHPDSTPIKKEEPDDWFSDKPVPTWTFGDRLVYWSKEDEKGNTAEVIGMVWLPQKKGHSWWYCLSTEIKESGTWHPEAEIEKDWVKERDT